MESQFQKMQKVIEEAKSDCEKGFGEDKASAEACTAKVPLPKPLFDLRQHLYESAYVKISYAL